MIINKIPLSGDLSGQPWEFRLSGVRALLAGRVLSDSGVNYVVTLTNAEKVAANYVIGQTYNAIYFEPSSFFLLNLTFTAISLTAAGPNWTFIFSLSEIVSTGPGSIIYLAKNNTSFLSSINVSITDTVTSVVNTFEFPVSTAGLCGFYLGSFLNNLVKAKGLVIPSDGGISPARQGDYNITVNGVILNYKIGYGGRFNLFQGGFNFVRQFNQGLPLFRRGNDFTAISYYDTDYGDTVFYLEGLPDGIQELSSGFPVPTQINVIPTCQSAGYRLQTLQLASGTYDITHPIIRFLNPLGGVEEAWANGVNELNLNQGEAAYSQTITGGVQLVGRKDSYQNMVLNLVPSEYLDNLRNIEAEINRLQAIRTSDYVELRLQNVAGGAGEWQSFQVQVQADGGNIASNKDNQDRASVTLAITFVNPL